MGLTRGNLLASWLAVGAVALATVARGSRSPTRGHALSAAREALRRLGSADLALLAGVVVAMGLVGAVAILSPPNSWDAMQYHLPRVVHWIAPGRVAPAMFDDIAVFVAPPGPPR